MSAKHQTIHAVGTSRHYHRNGRYCEPCGATYQKVFFRSPKSKRLRLVLKPVPDGSWCVDCGLEEDLDQLSIRPASVWLPEVFEGDDDPLCADCADDRLSNAIDHAVEREVERSR